MINSNNPPTDEGKFPRLLTAQDVANILNIGHSTAYQLLKRNDLPSIRIGRSVRVHPEDLEKYIASQTETFSDR